MRKRVFLGFDPHETVACRVAARSIVQHAAEPLDVSRLWLEPLRGRGLYTRPTETRDGKLWDVISEAPMSTEHAISRFLVPQLCTRVGWALFMDGDILARRDLGELFGLADDRYAVMCVHHHYVPAESTKKGGHVQTTYARKNWSSVMLFNCGHPANRALTPEVVNTWPGRDLHAFRWLDDALIGALPPRWNHLVGVTPDSADVAIAHFTLGTPDVLPSASPLAREWKEARHVAESRRVAS